MSPDEVTTGVLLTNLREALSIFPEILTLSFMFMMTVWGARKIAQMITQDTTRHRKDTAETTTSTWTTPTEMQAQRTSTAGDEDLERLRRTVEKGSL